MKNSHPRFWSTPTGLFFNFRTWSSCPSVSSLFDFIAVPIHAYIHAQ